jgi:hypothetical protein
MGLIPVTLRPQIEEALVGEMSVEILDLVLHIIGLVFISINEHVVAFGMIALSFQEVRAQSFARPK